MLASLTQLAQDLHVRKTFVACPLSARLIPLCWFFMRYKFVTYLFIAANKLCLMWSLILATLITRQLQSQSQLLSVVFILSVTSCYTHRST